MQNLNIPQTHTPASNEEPTSPVVLFSNDSFDGNTNNFITNSKQRLSSSALERLSSLSGLFPLTSQITSNSVIPNVFKLIDLPFEMILHIITFLPLEDDYYDKYIEIQKLKKIYLKNKNLFKEKKSKRNSNSNNKENNNNNKKRDYFNLFKTNHYFYDTFYKNIEFWKLLIEVYFHHSCADDAPFINKKILNEIYFNSSNTNLGSVFSQLKLTEEKDDEEQNLRLWQATFHYLFQSPRYDTDEEYLLPIFTYNKDRTEITRTVKDDGKKGPNAYRWRNVVSTRYRTFEPYNVYYFEFKIQKIGEINVAVGLVHDNFNPTENDNFIWPSGSCHHCFEVNHQRYYANETVGMIVDYSYSERNVMKLYFCHNYKLNAEGLLMEQLEKNGGDINSLDLENMQYLENLDVNSIFTINQLRMVYYTTNNQTQYPNCVITDDRNELIQFVKVPLLDENDKQQSDAFNESTKDVDVQKQRPKTFPLPLDLPNFKLCVTTYDNDDCVALVNPTKPYPSLYYQIKANGRFDGKWKNKELEMDVSEVDVATISEVFSSNKEEMTINNRIDDPNVEVVGTSANNDAKKKKKQCYIQ
ncbi:hypothetical protein ABK040_002062 [Willaertia magna]